MADRSLIELIRECHTGDADETALAVFELVGVPVRWRALFFPVVRDECRRQARAVVRGHERGVEDFTPEGATTSPSPTAGALPSVWVNDRAVFLRDNMYTGERYVSKGAATIQEWEQRAAFLTRLRDGYNETIDECVKVMRFLSAGNLSCLDDLPAVAS